jgi:tight adherence protein B
VVTDGKDVSSRHSFADAVSAARAAAAPVYTIGIAGPSFTPYALGRLARDTGGSYRVATSAAGLAATYRALRAELARTWSLSYLTSAAAADRVQLGVRVSGAGTARRFASMPSQTGRRSDTASGAIPAAGYGALGTLALGLAVGILLLLACYFWFAAGRGSRVQQRIEPHLGTVTKHGKARRAENRAATRAHFSDVVDSTFANVKQFKKVQRLIERADLPLRPGELLLICAGCGVIFGLVSSLAAQSALIAVVFTALGGALPLGYVSLKARSRLRKFEDQLPDLLITLAASLKAGHSFRQGIQSVVEEGAEPNAKEFQRVMSETQLGKPMDDALTHMAERVGSKDFTFVITAVTIQRQIGGSLSGLFDMVAETVRQRQQFSRKVRALTAMGRASAYVLVALPFFLAAVITMMNPVYMSPLYHTPLGQKLIIASLISVAIGSLILKKIASFRG